MADLIERQSAIDALAELARDRFTIQDVYQVYLDALKDADMRIRQMLSAQPEQRWILCSERLPDELEEVNVTWVNHKPEPYYDFVKEKPFTASAVYYKVDWYWYSSVCADLLAERGENEFDKIDDAIEITAWMPLPEPYKGES